MRKTVYSTIAGVPAVTRYVPAVVQLTANSFTPRDNARFIPMSLPRLRFIYGDVADTPEPAPAKVEPPPAVAAETENEIRRRELRERDAELLRLRGCGMTFTEIGRLKGMTPDSVRRAVARFTRREMKRSGSHKYIMPPTQLTELQQKVLDLKNSGLTLAEVGAALGRSTNAVSKLLAQAREKTGLVR